MSGRNIGDVTQDQAVELAEFGVGFPGRFDQLGEPVTRAGFPDIGDRIQHLAERGPQHALWRPGLRALGGELGAQSAKDKGGPLTHLGHGQLIVQVDRRGKSAFPLAKSAQAALSS